MENKIIQLEFSHNSQVQYARGKSFVLSGIPESHKGEYSEKKFSFKFIFIDVSMEPSEIEDCHRFGKSNNQNHIKKTIYASSIGKN